MQRNKTKSCDEHDPIWRAAFGYWDHVYYQRQTKVMKKSSYLLPENVVDQQEFLIPTKKTLLG